MTQYLNINSIGKVCDMKNILERKIDVSIIPETKTDKTLTIRWFSFQGYQTPNHFEKKGGLLVYIQEILPSKFLYQV